VALAAAGAVGLWWYVNRPATQLCLPGVVEIQETHLGSKVGGRVDRVAVAEGDQVQPGQPLVYLEAPELQAQLQQAQARLDAAQADLDKARNGNRFEEKEQARLAVSAAEQRWLRLKAGSRPEEIEQAKADLTSTEAELEGARQDLERGRVLIGPRAVNQGELDTLRATFNRLQGKVASNRARLKLLEAGSRAEDIAEAAAELDKARANYALLLAGTRSEDLASAEARVAELQARLEELKANLKETVVCAPTHAVVEVLAVRKGDLAAANQQILRILTAEDLWVKAYVPETELGKVRLNQEVAVTIDSYPGRRFPAVIYQIASTSEFTPRNIQSPDERRNQVFGVKVRITEPQGVFKSGMAASVWVPLHN